MPQPPRHLVVVVVLGQRFGRRTVGGTADTSRENRRHAVAIDMRQRQCPVAASTIDLDDSSARWHVALEMSPQKIGTVGKAAEDETAFTIRDGKGRGRTERRHHRTGKRGTAVILNDAPELPCEIAAGCGEACSGGRSASWA